MVAGDVRNLARRSAAAKEIKELIGDSVAKVATGSKLVGHAGSTMDEVVASVQRVSVMISDIVLADQTKGLRRGIDGMHSHRQGPVVRLVIVSSITGKMLQCKTY